MHMSGFVVVVVPLICKLMPASSTADTEDCYEDVLFLLQTIQSLRDP